MSKFIGREEELKLLNGLLTKQSASLVVVYGRRRIGKSRLIEEFGKNCRFVTFAGLFPDKNTTNQDQLSEFQTRFYEHFPACGDKNTFDDWSQALHALALSTQNEQIVILLDEISWMGGKDPNFLGKLKNAWDLKFKQNAKLVLVLCGSVSTWIEKNIIANRGFYGRISLKFCLRELLLEDCNKFWGCQEKNISSYEKFKILAVTGGVPKYLEEIKPEQSADDNIKRLCFNRSGLLFNDYDYIFASLLDRKSSYYQKIVELLSLGSLERKIIYDKLNMHTAEHLDELETSGFISCDLTWQLKTGVISKLSKYRLTDNYLRFYIKYIRPNIQKITNEQFSEHSLSALPGWATIMGLQVENMLLNSRRQLREKLGIYPDEVISDGPFFQRKTQRQQGCQIDYLVQTKFGIIYLCEIKFSRNVIYSTVIDEVQEKIKRLSLPRNFSIKPVLIHLGDVHDAIIDSGFFAQILDMGSLLEN